MTTVACFKLCDILHGNNCMLKLYGIVCMATVTVPNLHLQDSWKCESTRKYTVFLLPYACEFTWLYLVSNIQLPENLNYCQANCRLTKGLGSNISEYLQRVIFPRCKFSRISQMGSHSTQKIYSRMLYKVWLSTTIMTLVTLDMSIIFL